jgi:acyl carrier protein
MDSKAARMLIADHLAIDVRYVCDEASFAADLGADSLDMIELVMRFEHALGISIPDEEGDGCASVRDALDLVQRTIAQRQAA